MASSRARLAVSIGLLAIFAPAGCGGGDEPATPPPTATATTQAATPALPGLPVEELPLIAGYPGWTELTSAPVANLRSLGQGAHRGAKRIWASPAAGVGSGEQTFPYPRGSVVVKEARSGDAITLIAVMEKVRDDDDTGGWRYAEYTRTGGATDFAKVAFPESGCAACHANANTRQQTDWVFFKK